MILLKIGKILDGVKVYLGVKDGFDIKKEFGSNSTTIKESLGGLTGDKLKNGDVLEYAEYLNKHHLQRKWQTKIYPKI